jgi:general secretion pathway protein D
MPSRNIRRRALLGLASALLLAGAAGPRAAAPEAPPPADLPAADTAAVNFSFDQADLRILVKLVSDLTGRRFVVDDKVQGKVTVLTPAPIPVREVYPLFLAILEGSGYATVEGRDATLIVAREPRTAPAAPVVMPGEKPGPGQGLMTRVFQVRNLRAGDLRRALEPLMDSGKGGLAALEDTNHLIVTDTPAGLARLEQLLEQVDQPGLARMTEIVPLTFADAAQMAAELSQALAGGARGGAAADRLKQRLPPAPDAPSPAAEAVVVAAPHSNSLILVGTAAQIADLRRLIARMDVEAQKGRGWLRAIFLKYLTSEEAAKSLTSLLAKRMEKEPEHRIAIEANAANNALLIDASPQDYDMVRALLEELDTPPHQVLVEVLFAEATSSDGDEWGVEFLASGAPGDSAQPLGGMKLNTADDRLMADVLGGIVPNGLTFGIMKGRYTDASGRTIPGLPALVNLTAMHSEGRLRILSNIPLWAQNNQQASVSVGKNIPILKSTIAGGSGTARDIIENIDRVDVGIKLTVTPHVNPNDEVLMKLNPSIEAVIESSTGGRAFTPTIAKREVTTTVTVPNGQTIVISGLIREDTVKQLRRVPFLGSIPLLGYLFRSTVDGVERTNLLIFVTPHVIRTPADAAAARRLLEDRASRNPTGLTNTAAFAP